MKTSVHPQAKETTTMKTNFTMIMLIIMLAIGGTLASRAFADTGNDRVAGMHEHRHQGRWAKLAEVLDLTTEQQQQINAIITANRETNRPLHEKLRENRDALRSAVAGDQLDPQAIRTLEIEGANLKTDLLLSRKTTRQQIHALLTPEQQQLMEKLRPLLQQRDGHRKHHRGPGPGPVEPADS